VVADVRHILNRAGGSMADAGSVAWQFTRKAYFSFPMDNQNQDAIFELAVEAGADDVSFDEDTAEIFAPVEAFKEIADHLKAAGIKLDEAELRMVPNNEVELPTDEALQVMRVVEALEDLDDVQAVYYTLSISDDVLTQLEEA
jgi:transcriptional/translational regulatory protein YebC/TACO1